MVGNGLIVKVMVSITDPQGPAGSFDDKVNITEPEEISFAPGV